VQAVVADMQDFVEDQYNRSSSTECAIGFRLAIDRFHDTAA
jgi:hypothetical protein